MAAETTQRPEEERPRPRWTPGLRLACGGCAALGVVLIALATIGARTVTARLPEARATAEQFLSLCAAGKHEEARALTARKWRDSTNASDFQAFLDAFRETVGTSNRHTLLGNSWFGGIGGMPIALRYQAQHEGQAVQILLLLAVEREGMRVQACHFSKPSSRRRLLR